MNKTVILRDGETIFKTQNNQALIFNQNGDPLPSLYSTDFQLRGLQGSAGTNEFSFDSNHDTRNGAKQLYYRQRLDQQDSDSDGQEYEKNLKHYGIVGQVDFILSKYVLIITEVSKMNIDKDGIVVYKVKKVTPICVKNNENNTLDEQEFNSVTIRNIVSDLMDGSKFFSSDFDLTNSLQYIAKQGSSIENNVLNFDQVDERFFWNLPLLANLLDKSTQPFIVPILCGHVGMLSLSTSIPISIVILSRISRHRAGSRFFMRGADSVGNVAIEVETDVICISKAKTASFRILRGSVPLVWDQLNIGLAIAPPIDSSLITDERSIRSMTLHFERLLAIYGKGITALDLIEGAGSALENWNHPYVSYTRSPAIHNLASKIRLQQQIEPVLKNNGFFLCNNKTGNQKFEVIMKQIGVIRVNGLDCVDQTSIVQFAIAQKAIKNMLFELNAGRDLTRKEMGLIEKVWIEMADQIAEYYLGSTSLVAHLIHPTLYNNLFRIPTKAVVVTIRYYMSRFEDYGRQDRVDTVMNIKAPGVDSYRDQLLLRRRIIHADLSYNSFLTLTLILKRFTAPRMVETTFQFILALTWMVIYFIFIFFLHYDIGIFIRNPKILIRAGELPQLHYKTKGLKEHFEKLETKEINRYTSK